jgi:predicted O-methyltransferase YrrM
MLGVVRKALFNPRRAILRLVLLARLARTSQKKDRARVLKTISGLWEVDAVALAEEYRRSHLARWYRERMRSLRSGRDTIRLGTSSAFACEMLYVLVRAARPEVVVETGVLYGASSCHILAALEANGAGELHSIDLGTWPGEPMYNYLVHPALMGQWDYIEGEVRNELPGLLSRLGQIDMFYHDSVHTLEHMLWEYQVAGRFLRPGGLLASHDVRISHSLLGMFRENAFPRFCRYRGLQPVVARNTGFAIWGGRADGRSGGQLDVKGSAGLEAAIA